MTLDIDEADRQFLLLSLALCALLRPGFDYAAGEIAEKLRGRAMFEDFKRYNGGVREQANPADCDSAFDRINTGTSPQPG